MALLCGLTSKRIMGHIKKLLQRFIIGPNEQLRESDKSVDTRTEQEMIADRLAYDERQKEIRQRAEKAFASMELRDLMTWIEMSRPSHSGSCRPQSWYDHMERYSVAKAELDRRTGA